MRSRDKQLNFIPQIRVTPELAARVRAAAAADDRTITAWARRAIVRQLEVEAASRRPGVEIEAGGEK